MVVVDDTSLECELLADRECKLKLGAPVAYFPHPPLSIFVREQLVAVPYE